MSDLEDRGAAALDKLASQKKPRGKKSLRLVKGGSETFDPDGRRVIRHDPGKLPEILDQVGQALAEHDVNLYVSTTGLVRLYAAPEKSAKGVHRPHGTLTVHPVDADHMVELMTAAARHERYDKRAEAYGPCDGPRRVAQSYLARGHWPELRRLTGFVEAPTITPDGRLIAEPGHDADTGLFYAAGPMPGWNMPPGKPTRADAQAAVDLLLELFAAFPFVSDEDRAAAVAGVITALIRRSLPAAPMPAVTAPSPGTGKTMLAETFAILATGRRASVLSLGQDDAEAEKRIAGMLLAGLAIILLDNIERPLKGDLLCQVLTQQYVQLRPLGAHVMLQIPAHALLVATGNNLSIVGDLKRRTMLIRLDAGVERPEQRSFTRDHLEDVLARRGELIRAALTIPLAYLAAGSPAVDGIYPLGGFDHWDRLVRRPLAWLGLPDPLKGSEGLREQDPDLEGMRLLLGSWHAAFGSEPMTASELIKAANDWRPTSETYAHPDLHEALQIICFEKPTSRKVGNWLRNHRDKIIDDLQLKQAGTDTHSKVLRWRVVPC